MKLRKKTEQRNIPLGRSFRYENAWQTIGDNDKKIAEVWKDKCQSSGLAGVAKTLKDMQGELATWGKSNLGNFKEKLAKLRQELGRARMKSVGWGPSQEEKNIMGRINRVLHQEEIWIKQRARI
jgi:hypothetical protein